MCQLNAKISSRLIKFCFVLSLMFVLGCDSDESSNDLYQGKLVNSTLAMEFTADEVSMAIAEYFSGTGIDVTDLIEHSNQVVAYSLEYCTKDVDGSLIIVSGLAAFPVLPVISDANFPVVQYHHGTQFNKQDVPSNYERSPEALLCMALFAGHGYITSMPDYIGNGKSNATRPYMQADSAATSSADCLKAVNELCGQLNIKTNSSLFILGLSEGGQATLALQKLVESDTNEVPFNLTASAPIAGPYNLPETWDFWLTNPPQCSPYTVHLILAFREVYNLPDTLSEIFLAPWDAQVETIDNGNYNNDEMYYMLPKNLQDLLQPEFVNRVNTKDDPFYYALADNIIDDFGPTTPTRLLHSQGDKQLLYSFSEKSAKKMNALGALDLELVSLGLDYSHVDSFIPGVLTAKFWFDQFGSAAYPDTLKN